MSEYIFAQPRNLGREKGNYITILVYLYFVCNVFKNKEML